MVISFRNPLVAFQVNPSGEPITIMASISVPRSSFNPSICPKTNQPDFGTIEIEYVADKLCVELKSLKFYLHGFRGVGVFYEDVVNRILNDLLAALKPRQMTVMGKFTPRGGIHSIITAEFNPAEPPVVSPSEPTRTSDS